MQEQRHLINKSAGTAGTGAVHPLFRGASEIGDFCVFTAELNDDVSLGNKSFHRFGAGDDFLNETLITCQMLYEQMQAVGQAREMDFSYASYTTRNEYNSIDVNTPYAVVNVLDEIKFCLAADPEVESTAGDTHILQLEKIEGIWKITDDQCDLAGYYSQRYEAYKSKCPYEDIDRINVYIIEKFRSEVKMGLDSAQNLP